MFTLDLPYRNRKDAPRTSPSVRGFSRRRHGTSPTTALDHRLWMPVMSPDFWRRDFMSGNTAPAPDIGRFETLDAMPFLPRAMRPPADGSRYSGGGGGDDRFGRSATDRGEWSANEAVPFDQAADALCQALHFAIKHCKSIREAFNQEVAKSSIASWAPPKVVDALWSMKLDWDGINPGEAAESNNRNVQCSPETVTYKDVVQNLNKALEALKTCGRPRVEFLGEAECKLSPEVFRNTMKKLQCTMSGIEELMVSARSDRSLMDHLVKDMVAATALLGEIEELWLPAAR